MENELPPITQAGEDLLRKLLGEESAEFAKQNPGNKQFVCELCGIYKASKPRCNKCSEEK